MTDFAVVQQIRLPGERRMQYVVRGIIRGVPAGTTPAAVRDALTEAGQAPREAGIVWANHAPMPLERVPEGAQMAVKGAEWQWDELGSPARRAQLNVRLRPRLLADCRAAAELEGETLNDWVERVLSEAVRSGQAQTV